MSEQKNRLAGPLGSGQVEQPEGDPSVIEELRLLRQLLRAYLKPRGAFEQIIPRSQVGTADGSGNVTLDLGTPTLGHAWWVQRINRNASAGTPAVKVFVGPQNNISETNRRDFSPSGLADDQADEVNPIYVGPGDFLTVRFIGATASAICTVACQISLRPVDAPGLL